jgi:glutamyl-tRNA synthetase
MSVRVRFAPSPTGHLHIGGLRAALFNWLFARSCKGSFLIRIEDTDYERSTKEYQQSIIDSFSWSGIESDEPLVIQSERAPEHIRAAYQLVAQGKAYICICSSQELETRLGTNAAQGTGYTRYDGACRDKKYNQNELKQPFVIRFKIPDNVQTIVFKDLIRGEISFDPAILDDFIIVRSGNLPMYNFVVVLDDAFMGITHVIRGEDHISNTPKQILLYHALGYTLPEFGHLPLILGPDGARLSKRDAATSVLDYKKNGFLAQALINYLARLGWSSGDQEIFTLQELINQFSLEAIGKKGAIFDIKKLEWVNSVYLKQTSGQELFKLILRDTEPQLLSRCSNWSEAQIISALELYKGRVKTLVELTEEIIPLSFAPAEYNEKDCATWLTQSTADSLAPLFSLLETTKLWQSSQLSAVIKQYAQDYLLPLPHIAQPLRIALTGKTTSPGVFELMELIGKNEFFARIEKLFKRR